MTYGCDKYALFGDIANYSLAADQGNADMAIPGRRAYYSGGGFGLGRT
jgi:hypothetical protein